MDSQDIVSIINAHLDKCVEEFAKGIKYGYGWIVKEDIMRQFTQSYPEFASELFNKDFLEEIISVKLQSYVSVKTEDEAFEEGLLDA